MLHNSQNKTKVEVEWVASCECVTQFSIKGIISPSTIFDLECHLKFVECYSSKKNKS